MNNEQQAWINKNRQLQSAYERYNRASIKSEREIALREIEIALEYNPFMNYVMNNGGHTTGLVRYGLDTLTRRSIEDINDIANGQRGYVF